MPKLLTTPFAAESQLRTNIQESQGAESNSATYRFGFPEETMKKIALGGKPPKGEDMNGILYDLSDNIVFQTQGGRYKFDPTYANKIGGYPVNAILQLENGTEVINKNPNNTTNPNVDMTGWGFASATKDSELMTWSGRTQESKNKDFINSRDYNIKPNVDYDQYQKFKEMFENQGVITIEPGLYLFNGAVKDLLLNSNTTLNAFGVTLDYRNTTSTSTGRLKAQGVLNETNLVLLSDAKQGDMYVELNLSESIEIGMVLYIKSEIKFTTDTKKAEILKVRAVIGKTVFLEKPLQLNYSAATDKVSIVDAASNVHINGISLIGRGAIDDATGLNDRGLMINYADNCSIRGARIFNFDRMGILAGNMYETDIKRCFVNMTERINPSHEYIQYGISLFDAISGGVVSGCNVSKGKHGIVYTSYAGYGVSSGHTVKHNNVNKTWHAGIATHKTNTDLEIINNDLLSCGYGFDIRVPNAKVKHNTAVGTKNTATILRGNFSGLDYQDNTLDGGVTGMTANELVGDINSVTIDKNNFKNFSNYAISINIPRSLKATGFNIKRNEFSKVSADCVALTGDFVDLDVASNDFKDFNAVRYAVRLFGVDGARVTKNFAQGRLLRIENDGNIPCKNIKHIDNSWQGDVFAAYPASGNSTGFYQKGNYQVEGDRSVNVLNNAIAIPAGVGYVSVYASKTETISNITSFSSIGDEIALSKSGAGTVTLVSGGNIKTSPDSITLNDGDVVGFIFNGVSWLQRV